MLETGVIEYSGNPGMSPVVLVKKKAGATRFCVDYRQHNNIKHKDSSSLPRLDDAFHAVAGSNLDLKSGDWQV